MDSIGTAILRAFGPPDGEGYGLQIIERVRRQTRGEVHLQQEILDPWLLILVRDGLLHSWQWRDESAGRRSRPRRYYALTSRGWDLALPLRGLVDPKSHAPVGRAPIIVRGIVASMTPPLRSHARVKDTVNVQIEDDIDLMFRHAKTKAAKGQVAHA